MNFDPPAASPADLADGRPRDATRARRDPDRDRRGGGLLVGHPTPATAAFLEQAGCRVDRILLAEHGVHGNGHLMMIELNNREVLEPILRWLDRLD